MLLPVLEAGVQHPVLELTWCVDSKPQDMQAAAELPELRKNSSPRLVSPRPPCLSARID
jgi:hypothetical protein